MRNISDILKEERVKKGFALDDVVAALKIKKSFLAAIEEGNFHVLPSESYALGFIKNYASFLGVSKARAAALFRREYEASKIEIMPKFRKGGFSGRKLSLRSGKSYFILFCIFVVLVYVVYQFSFLFIGPRLSLSSPTEGKIITSNTVEVSGKTDPYATVTVNKEEVYVDLTGSFFKNLYVYSGDAKIVITAKNRYGKQTQKQIDVKVE